MNDLFGIPTTNIAIVLSAIFGVALATVGAIALTNRTMFRMGLRNLPRRGAQTGLVVVGLMLSTLIVTAAFTTGDTIDHTLTKGGYELFRGTAIEVGWNGEPGYSSDSGTSAQGSQKYGNERAVAVLERQFQGDADIRGFMPVLREQVPARDVTTGQAVPAIQLSGYDPARLAAFGGLTLTNGDKAPLDLAAGSIYLNKRAADELSARTGDTVALYVDGKANEFTVAGIVENELASGMMGLEYSTVPGGAALPIESLRQLVGFENNEISGIAVALHGELRTDIEHSEPAAAKLASYFASESGKEFAAAVALPEGLGPHIFQVKDDAIEEGKFSGAIFTTFFLVLGLFSMAAGIMLIFMIFVMLAAERKAEMGMARAVGAQRMHLVQSFISEGMAYSLLAGVVGAALGVLASVGMTAGLLKLVGGDYFSIVEVKLTWKSIVIGYTLGVAITFVTVVFASLKVTHVNIVAAIRNLPEDKARAGRRKVRWLWVVAGVPAMVVPPLGIWFLFRKGLGLPWTWILAPLGLVFAALMMMLGKSSELLFPFSLGISLIPLCIAAMVRYLGIPNRPLWTVVGLVLAAYWLTPTNVHDSIFGEFSSDIEMFVLSGIMVVVSFTLVIVFNARLLTVLFNRSGSGLLAYRTPIALLAATIATVVAGLTIDDGGNGLGELIFLVAGLLVPTTALSFAAAKFGSLAPALKMAVAYPLSNRFRTGMTIAMFSLIVFSLTVFSIIMGNFATLEGNASARGNLDIVGTIGEKSPIRHVPAALREQQSPAAAQIAGSGAATLYNGSSRVHQPGLPADFDSCVAGKWCNYPVVAANDGFLTSLEPGLDSWANGYGSPREVLEAVRTNPNLALIDGTPMGRGFNEHFEWTVREVTIEDDRFEPFELQFQNPLTGESRTVTVVGVLQTRVSSSLTSGLYINEAAYTAAFGAPDYQRYYLRLDPEADAKRAARDIEAALAVQGVEADSVKKLLDDAGAQNKAFQRMFQAFMALGLLVGIAGLGVIAFRSVVERRQQIGMLRAIGFQRGTISLTFLLESSFVAAMGILAGVVGGAVIGRNLITSGGIESDSTNVAFSLPWSEIIFLVAAAYAFSLLMTWWPSRGASRVPVAEALRYE